MNCPNCGLPNPDNAKFCSNCGTSFGSAPSQPPPSYQSQSQYQTPPPSSYQSPTSYPPPVAPQGGNSLAKNIAIGCLIVLAIFMFLGLSCTRACFRLGHGRYAHTRYY